MIRLEWNDIWKIVLCAVSSAGGIGAIIILVIKFCSNFIAEQLAKKYEIKLQKDLEKYKSGLDNKIYITKAKFDAEFELYRNLSSAFFKAVKAVTTMIPAGLAYYPADKEDRKKYEEGLYDKASAATVTAQDILYCNIAFIPKELYEKYKEILHMCNIQVSVFQERWNVNYLVTQAEKERFSPEDFKRSREILDKFYQLNDELREYLSKLDVLE